MTLTIHSVRTRIVSMKMRRPVVSRAVTLSDWPALLIDLQTEEGVTGRAYLSAYTVENARHAADLIQGLVDRFRGEPVAPVDLYDKGRKALFFSGYEGMTLSAVSGLDMALWDAAARAANLPLVEFLGGARKPSAVGSRAAHADSLCACPNPIVCFRSPSSA